MRRMLLAFAGVAGLATAVVPALAIDRGVTVNDSYYSPSAVAVRPGETLTIDRAPDSAGEHNVHWDDRAAAEMAPTSGPIHLTRTFTAGDDNRSFVFRCDVHGRYGMTATVYVDDAGTVPTAPPPGGTTTTTTTVTPTYT